MQLFGDSDTEDCSSTSNWILLSPNQRSLEIGASQKAAPAALPATLNQPSVPRIRAPFQVASQQTSLHPRPPARQQMDTESLHCSSIPVPKFTRPQVPSLSHQFHRIHNSESAGLPAPVFQRPAPCSHLAPASVKDDSSLHGLQSAPLSLYQPADLSGPGGHSHLGHAPAEPHLTRIKLAAASSIVLQLWSNFTAVFTQFSVTLQQMTTSANYLEHRNRFLNQFAATTLIRYMTAALQVFRLLQVLQLDLNSLSAWHLADVLIAGSMARRSDGSGPKTSIAIKAMRWCYKQLQIQTFQEVGNSIISSFDKQ